MSLYKRFASNSPNSQRQAVQTETVDVSVAINRIMEHLKNIDEKIQNLDKKVDRLTDSPPTWYQSRLSPVMKEVTESHPAIGSLAFTAFILKESSKMAEKSCNAVLEKFPDIQHRAEGKEKLEQDGAMIHQVCEKANLAKPIDFWRQPCKNQKNPRVIKVRFNSTEDRDNFLKAFKKNYQGPGRPPISRRDLTVPELELLYALRNQVYKANSECGQARFYVHHDLTIRENTNPKPFAVRKP